MFDRKTYYREYYKKHREEISKARKDSYSGEHAEEIRRKALEYYHAHKEEIQAKNKERYHTDEEYREYRRRHSREHARKRRERAELALPEECINV